MQNSLKHTQGNLRFIIIKRIIFTCKSVKFISSNIFYLESSIFKISFFHLLLFELIFQFQLIFFLCFDLASFLFLLIFFRCKRSYSFKTPRTIISIGLLKRRNNFILDTFDRAYFILRNFHFNLMNFHFFLVSPVNQRCDFIVIAVRRSIV